MLDRIKLRHLLDKAQEILAVATGLTTQGEFGASLAWRVALGSSDDLSTRMTLARALLHKPGIKLDQRTQTFASTTKLSP